MIECKRKPYNKLELVGRQFGKLTVESEQIGWNRHQKSIRICKCECGNTCTVTGSKLTSGWTQSCGCLQRERTGESAIERAVGRANRLPEGEAAAHAAYRVKTGNARKRGINFELTEDQFRQLSSQNCFYCGREPSNRYNNNNGRKGYYHGDFIHSGIDRVDNTKGYLFENCVPCCKECNFMKADITPDMVYKLYWKLIEMENAE